VNLSPPGANSIELPRASGLLGRIEATSKDGVVMFWASAVTVNARRKTISMSSVGEDVRESDVVQKETAFYN
jgi:hypothetical protein